MNDTIFVLGVGEHVVPMFAEKRVCSSDTFVSFGWLIHLKHFSILVRYPYTQTPSPNVHLADEHALHIQQPWTRWRTDHERYTIRDIYSAHQKRAVFFCARRRPPTMASHRITRTKCYFSFVAGVTRHELSKQLTATNRTDSNSLQNNELHGRHAT
jgi:hypothetical protein